MKFTKQQCEDKHAYYRKVVSKARFNKKSMWIKSRADGVAGKQGKYRRYTGYICIEEIMMEIRGEGSTCDSPREIMGVGNCVELVVHQLYIKL